MKKKKKHERPLFLHSPHLKWSFIQEKAEEFRRKYVNPIDLVPVPIIKIVEVDLGIQPIPEVDLLSKIDIDGFLTRDLKHICIDQNIYMDDRYINRLNFTYAHEVGHLVLHEAQIKLCDFRTPDDWIYFHQDFREDDLLWFENQAREFAGRLLVPRERLLEEVLKRREKIIEYRSQVNNEETEVIEAVSRGICKAFEVSYQVIQKRIRIEKVWDELDL